MSHEHISISELGFNGIIIIGKRLKQQNTVEALDVNRNALKEEGRFWGLQFNIFEAIKVKFSSRMWTFCKVTRGACRYCVASEVMHIDF